VQETRARHRMSSICTPSEAISPSSASLKPRAGATEGTIALMNLHFVSRGPWRAAAVLCVGMLTAACGVDHGGGGGGYGPGYGVLGGAGGSAGTGAAGSGGDSPAFIVRPSTTDTDRLRTTEAGGQASFTVRLSSAPTGNVTIDLVSSRPAEGVVSPAALTFSPANWNSPQSCIVTGVDDSVPDGDQPYEIQFPASVSNDPRYNGLAVSPVFVTNVDNDAAATINAIAVSCVPRGGTGGLTCLPAAAGYDVLCTATATMSDSSSADITATATFASLAPSVAALADGTVTVDGKVYRSVSIAGAGTATITASQAGVTSATTGTLGTSAYVIGGTLDTVAAISVTTATATIPVGGSTQLTATAMFSTSTAGCQAPPARDVTSLATWSSDTTSVFANPVLGLVTGLMAGTANAVAQYGNVSGSLAVHVTNPGPAWTFQQPDARGRDLSAVWGSSAGDVYVVGIQGAAYHSVDGGATWTPLTIAADQLFGIWGTSASNIYVVGGTTGSGNIYRFDGTSWSTVASPGQAMFAVWGSGAADVYAVGAGGTILHATDGKTFTPQTSNTTVDLLAIGGSGASDVFVVGGIGGQAGLIAHTADGGATWTPQFMTSAVSDALDGIWAFGGGTAVVSDLQGNALIATSNDGTAWTPGANSPGTGGGLYGIWASAPGTGALIAHTTGLGAPLTAETLPATDVGDGFSAIWGSSATDVYAVGVNGRIAHKH
jgi:large repetitive protein